MSNKRLFILSLVPALILFTAYGVWAMTKSDDSTKKQASQSTSVTPAPTTNDSTSPETTATDNAEQTFTAAEVAEHNSADDCWSIIDGNVYDLTSYVPRHPGGNEILAACGTDGSSLFNQRQTADGQSVGSGSPHSSNAQSQLQALFIGKLAG